MLRLLWIAGMLYIMLTVFGPAITWFLFCFVAFVAFVVYLGAKSGGEVSNPDTRNS